MEPIDVVVRFYRKHACWPLVAKGLERNGDLIKRVIVVNDEPWDGDEVQCDLDMVHLDHPHVGFGAHKSFNQGAAAVKTEYFLNIDGDMILDNDSIANNLEYAEPGMLVAGIIHDTCYNPQDVDPDKPQTIRADWRLLRPDSRLWPMMRIGHMLIHKPTSDALGGHDLNYNGYGLIDFDYGTRWIIEHGPEAFTLGAGAAFHIGGIDRPEDKTWKQVSPESQARFASTISRLEEKYDEYPDLY